MFTIYRIDVENLKIEEVGTVTDEEADSNVGEADFAFGLEDHSFGKLITDNQIMICITENDEEYVAWFNSGVVSPEGILEANNYDDTSHNDEPFTADEKELIYYLRTLEFDVYWMPSLVSVTKRSRANRRLLSICAKGTYRLRMASTNGLPGLNSWLI